VRATTTDTPGVGSARIRCTSAAVTTIYAYVFNDPINKVDPGGLEASDDALKWASDFSAGFGDAITGGLTRKVREWRGTNDVVDQCSMLYRAG
jgi:hypothetical protein